jgi:hypothetical protein
LLYRFWSSCSCATGTRDAGHTCSASLLFQCDFYPSPWHCVTLACCDLIYSCLDRDALDPKCRYLYVRECQIYDGHNGIVEPLFTREHVIDDYYIMTKYCKAKYDPHWPDAAYFASCKPSVGLPVEHPTLFVATYSPLWDASFTPGDVDAFAEDQLAKQAAAAEAAREAAAAANAAESP